MIRHFRTALAATFAAAAFLMAACDSEPESVESEVQEERMQEEVSEAADATGDYLREQGEAVRQDLDRALSNLEKEWPELRRKSARAAEEAGEELTALIHNLENSLEQARHDFEQWSESEQAEDVRRNIEQTIDGLQTQFERASEEIEKHLSRVDVDVDYESQETGEPTPYPAETDSDAVDSPETQPAP